jgi:hypothetical protein
MSILPARRLAATLVRSRGFTTSSIAFRPINPAHPAHPADIVSGAVVGPPTVHDTNAEIAADTISDAPGMSRDLAHVPWHSNACFTFCRGRENARHVTTLIPLKSHADARSRTPIQARQDLQADKDDDAIWKGKDKAVED